MKFVDGTNQALSAGELHSLWETALDLVGGDHAAAVRVLEMLAKTNQATVASLRGNVDAASWESVGRAAHLLTGSARMLERPELVALLTQLEAAAHGRNVALAMELLPSVIDAIETLDVSIERAVSNHS